MTDIQKAVIKLMALWIVCGLLVSIYETRDKPQELEIQIAEICNAMESSYTADRCIYEKYHRSEVEEERQRADQAKVRANKTASDYNVFVEENDYPDGAKRRLDYIY